MQPEIIIWFKLTHSERQMRVHANVSNAWLSVTRSIGRQQWTGTRDLNRKSRPDWDMCGGEFRKAIEIDLHLSKLIKSMSIKLEFLGFVIRCVFVWHKMQAA